MLFMLPESQAAEDGSKLGRTNRGNRNTATKRKEKGVSERNRRRKPIKVDERRKSKNNKGEEEQD